jgi:hypothetical protein
MIMAGKTTKDLDAKLQALIKRHGLQKVLGSLANIVGANEGHKDEEDAKAWGKAGNAIDFAREIIESRFVL